MGSKVLLEVPSGSLPKIKMRRACLLRSSPSDSHYKSEPLPKPQFLQRGRMSQGLPSEDLVGPRPVSEELDP